jgi:hypothetical protein
LEDFGLEEKDIEIFKTGFDPSSKKQSEDVAKVYEKITK